MAFQHLSEKERYIISLRPGESGLSSVMRRLMTCLPSHIASVTSGKDTFLEPLQELCGGLLRSVGGSAAGLSQSLEDWQASDERILGSVDFVESVLRENDPFINKPTTKIDDVLHEKWGKDNG